MDPTPVSSGLNSAKSLTTFLLNLAPWTKALTAYQNQKWNTWSVNSFVVVTDCWTIWAFLPWNCICVLKVRLLCLLNIYSHWFSQSLVHSGEKYQVLRKTFQLLLFQANVSVQVPLYILQNVPPHDLWIKTKVNNKTEDILLISVLSISSSSRPIFKDPRKNPSGPE